MAIEIAQRLKDFASVFDDRFARLLAPDSQAPSELVEAVRYAALAPGKRLRPFLVGRCCELTGGTLDRAWPAAAAVECVHAFSLVHDDLPAMDDDDLRRGRPTCHKQFDEATAILAGDALVVFAFELLAAQVENTALAARLVLELARGTGWTGMIGGQSADIVGQRIPPERSLAEYIHERKTARLFETACRLGAMIGGGDELNIDACGRYGQMLGRAFQITDDLLDVTANADTMGKQTGKDADASKQTFPQCVGIEESRRAATASADHAIAALAPFGHHADDLRALAAFVVDRNY